MRKTKEINNRSNGITLIALVITIIVLIILAGVTIATITGDNGIIAQAMNAKNQTEIAGVKEGVLIDILEAEAESRNGITKEQFVKILGDYFMDVPTADELPEDLSTLILTTKDKYGEHKINISEIYNGDFSDTIVVAEKTIEDLKVGDKVYYIDKNNVKRECIVLYDASSEYGVQIITADIVEDMVTLRSSDFDTARQSYNNALKTLYEEAQKYLNTTYASGARCVGSDPADPDWDATTDEEGNLVNEAGYYTKEIAKEQNSYYSYMDLYYDTFKNKDENSNIDLTQMSTITNVDIKRASNPYWLASRALVITSGNSNFDIRYWNTNYSGVFYYEVCMVHTSLGEVGYSPSCGFRPVFTLKSGIKITEGDGVSVPYTLVP